MYVCVYSYLSLQHTQFGSSMRSLALLRFGGCEYFLKSVRALSRLCFGIYVFAPIVSVPLGIGLCCLEMIWGTGGELHGTHWADVKPTF